MDKSTEKQTPKTIRFGKYRIPADLSWLVSDQDMNPTGVLSLMKMASAIGQRLSDIVSFSVARLKKFKGRQLFAYLRVLIGSSRDWSYMEKQRVQTVTAEVESVKAKKAHSEFCAAIKDRYFRSIDGENMFAIGANGYVNGAWVKWTNERGVLLTGGMPTISESFVADISASRIVECSAKEFLQF